MSKSQKEKLYSIRRLRDDVLADCQAVDRLEQACAQGVTMKYYFACEEVAHPRGHKFDDYVILLAEHVETSEIVGTATANVRTVRFGEDSYENVSWLCSLRVDPDHRGHGLAIRLVDEMEKILAREKNVGLVYVGLSTDNVPSNNLFREKLGYTYFFTETWPQINVAHYAMTGVFSSANDPGVTITKLNQDETNKFLLEHLSKTFFFPKDVAAAKSTVHVAKIEETGEFVGLNVFNSRSLVGFLDIPQYEKLLRAVKWGLSYLLPSYFERPFPLGRPHACVNAFPFVIKTSSPQSTRKLIKAVLGHVIQDMSDRNYADILLFAASSLGNVTTEDNVAIINEFFPTSIPWGDHYCGKSLKTNADEAKAMIETIKQQKFWFIDGREL